MTFSGVFPSLSGVALKVGTCTLVEGAHQIGEPEGGAAQRTEC